MAENAGNEGPPPPYMYNPTPSTADEGQENQASAPPQGENPPPQGAYPPPQGAYPPPQPHEAYPPPASQAAYPLPNQDVAGAKNGAYTTNEPPPKYQDLPHYNGQQGYQYPTNYGATTVIQQPVPVTTTVVHIFSDQPTTIQCPNCRQVVTTHVCLETNALAWLMCLVMFLLGLWICCWIPFVIDDLKDVTHICPRCRRQLGRYKKM